MRSLWLAAIAAEVALVLTLPILGVIAAVTESVRLGNVCLVLVLTAAGGGMAVAMWSDISRPERGLPRAVRKRLREEEARIRLQSEIARLEREAGLST